MLTKIAGTSECHEIYPFRQGLLRYRGTGWRARMSACSTIGRHRQERAGRLWSQKAEEMVGNLIISWSPDMTVGVLALDNEHRLLISEINTLSATSQSANRQAIESCLARLATYAVKHFHNEESYMAKMRYSRLDDHKEKHDEFTARIQRFIIRLDREDHRLVAVEILQFLVDWWTQHILTDDKHYALEADF